MNYTNSATRLAKPRPREDSAPQILTVERDARGVHLRLRRVATAARRGLLRATAAILACSAALLSARAQSYSLNLPTPTLDKWVYPFASSGGGTRTSAPTFGSLGATAGQFDDRDGQFLVGFNTTTIPSGRGASSYLITSATLTLTLSASVADLVVFDGTYDPISSYAPDGSAIDGDAGRPVELYGAGYRNGFTALSILENTAYAPTGPTVDEGARSTFATDFSGGVARDVSNNYRDAFDPVPFAIGHVAAADLNPDGTIVEGAAMTFTLNLVNPNVLAYLQSALDLGRINLLASSLAPASQGGTPNRPEFDTKEMGALGTPPSLQIAVTVVPEPQVSSLCIVGAALVACWRRRRAIFGEEEAS